MGFGFEFREGGVFKAFMSTRFELAICEGGVFGKFRLTEFEFVF